MTDVKDGGPAFPDPARGHSQGHPNDAADTSTVRTGVTVRDYFAAAAMKGIYPGADHVDIRQIQQDARLFYAIADAMLKERER